MTVNNLTYLAYKKLSVANKRKLPNNVRVVLGERFGHERNQLARNKKVMSVARREKLKTRFLEYARNTTMHGNNLNLNRENMNTQPYKKLNITPKEFNYIKRRLIKNEYISETRLLKKGKTFLNTRTKKSF